MWDVKALLREAAAHPLLERDEERRLARDAVAGDAEAARRLALSHLRYVIGIARRYQGSGLPMGDLVQEGTLGLMRAIKGFDPDNGARFSTYAGWWIRSAIQDHVVRSWSLVRIGTTNAQKALFLRLRQMRDGAEGMGEEMTASLARHFDTTAAEVRSLANRVRRADQAGPEALEALACPAPTPEGAAETRVLADLVERALTLLPDREALIIRRRYFDEARMTFEAIGRELGLGKDRVRQLEAKALERLREILGAALPEGRRSSGL